MQIDLNNSKKPNLLFLNTTLVLFFSLNAVLYLLGRLALDECGIIFLIQGMLTLIAMLLYPYRRSYSTSISKAVVALNIPIIINLSLSNTLLLYRMYNLNSIPTVFLFNIGLIFLLQSFIAKFSNADEVFIYCSGIVSIIINILGNRIELVFTALIIVMLYLSKEILWYGECIIKMLMLYSILTVFHRLPHIIFLTSSLLLSKSYGYLESIPDTYTGCIPSYGFRSLIYTIISFTLISIAIKLGMEIFAI